MKDKLVNGGVAESAQLKRVPLIGSGEAPETTADAPLTRIEIQTEMNPRLLVLLTLVGGGLLLLIGFSSCETTAPTSPQQSPASQKSAPEGSNSRNQGGQPSGYQGSGY